MSYFRRAPDDGEGPSERKPNEVPTDIIREYYKRVAETTKRPSPREHHDRRRIEVEIEVNPGQQRPRDAPPERVVYTQPHVIIDIRVEDVSEEICYIATENGFDVHDRTYNGVSHRMGSNWIEHSVSDVLGFIRVYGFWWHAPLNILKITIAAEEGIPYLQHFMEKAKPIRIRCRDFEINCPAAFWGELDRRPFECVELCRNLRISNYQMRGVTFEDIAKILDEKKMWSCTLDTPRNVANLMPGRYESVENHPRVYTTTFAPNQIIISTPDF